MVLDPAVEGTIEDKDDPPTNVSPITLLLRGIDVFHPWATTTGRHRSIYFKINYVSNNN
jgi:hypothetical protein